MACGIYKITNLINNQCYIGQSINIERRWTQEKRKAFRKKDPSYNYLLSRAFRKYGIENFSFEILEECSKEDLDDREVYYISKYDSYFNRYNQTTGGQISNGYNSCVKISKEDLLEIYDLLQNSSISQSEIAKQFNVGKDVISTINHGKSRRLSGYTYPLRDNNKKISYCCDCGIQIDYRAVRCATCEKKAKRVVERPERNELKKMIREMPFVKIAEIYGVSDKAITKWCSAANLPKRKEDINTYSDEECDKI